MLITIIIIIIGISIPYSYSFLINKSYWVALKKTIILLLQKIETTIFFTYHSILKLAQARSVSLSKQIFCQRRSKPFSQHLQ